VCKHLDASMQLAKICIGNVWASDCGDFALCKYFSSNFQLKCL